MTNGEKMTALLRLLKKEMNGAVADSMREKGMEYPLNYGVSIPVLRRIAAAYAPDHPLARLLYQQQVRELRLAALTVADPACVTEQELEFWAEGVSTTEVAEHLASTLMCRTGVVGAVLSEWLAPEQNDLLHYAALLTGAWALRNGQTQGVAWVDALPLVTAVLPSERRYVWDGGVQFLFRLVERFPELRSQVEQLVDEAKQRGVPCADFLREELAWRLES